MMIHLKFKFKKIANFSLYLSNSYKEKYQISINSDSIPNIIHSLKSFDKRENKKKGASFEKHYFFMTW